MKNAIKIMFVNSIDVSKGIETTLPQLGLGYLSSSLRKKFGDDCIEFKIINHSVEQEIAAFQPDIVGITSVSQNYNRAIEYASMAKQHNLSVIMGGVHISALPSTLTSDMDVGVIGEGEETIVDLIGIYLEDGSFDEAHLSDIKGIVFRKSGKIFLTEKREHIKPLDRIAMPARDLLEIKKTTYIFSSRGCPYNCTFCASCRFWDSVRLFSAEYVVDEIEVLVRQYNVKTIFFWDDLFVANRKRLRDILELLKERGLLGRVDFTCHVRSNVLDDELALLLKQMNVRGVGMGLESGFETTLQYLKGTNIGIKDHLTAISILKKHKMNFFASFIIGSPQESREDILKTLEFIKRNNVTAFDINVLTPLPGTPIWDYAKERKLVSEEMDWSRLNVNFGDDPENAIILSEKLTREEIYELFLLFIKLKKASMIKRALKDPRKIMRGFIKLLSGKSPAARGH